MKTSTVKFSATTILTNDKEVGTFSGTIYSMLNYLENIGLNLSMQKLYSLKKDVVYLIEGDNLNNLGCDFKHRKEFTEMRSNNLHIHVRIKRETKVIPYFNK